MRYRFLAFLSMGLSFAVGCDLAGPKIDVGGSDYVPSSSGGYGDPGPAAGCVADVRIPCAGEAHGFLCGAGSGPEDQDDTLSCGTGVVDTAGDESYCCTLTGFTGAYCTPSTSACPAGEPYAYQCVPGNEPSTYDASLVCDDPTSDPDRAHDDFCCGYVMGGGGSSGGGSSSSGGDGAAPLSGCTPDPTIPCMGAASGYACSAGTDPETDDPGRACSTPGFRGGEIDYCCYDGFPGGPDTCLPDDALTSMCPGASTYGYQCLPGYDPSTLDPSLVCDTPTTDYDVVHDDYCCTHPQ